MMDSRNRFGLQVLVSNYGCLLVKYCRMILLFSTLLTLLMLMFFLVNRHHCLQHVVALQAEQTQLQGRLLLSQQRVALLQSQQVQARKPPTVWQCFQDTLSCIASTSLSLVQFQSAVKVKKTASEYVLTLVLLGSLPELLAVVAKFATQARYFCAALVLNRKPAGAELTLKLTFTTQTGVV